MTNWTNVRKVLSLDLSSPSEVISNLYLFSPCGGLPTHLWSSRATNKSQIKPTMKQRWNNALRHREIPGLSNNTTGILEQTKSTSWTPVRHENAPAQTTQWIVAKSGPSQNPNPNPSEVHLLCFRHLSESLFLCLALYTEEVNLQTFVMIKCKFVYVSMPTGTVNHLYTDTRYNDTIRYNDNLNVTKPSLKRWQLMRNYARILH